MPQLSALAKQDTYRLSRMQAELNACLALSRATLQALAALSPMAGKTAAAALSDEAEVASSSDARRIIREVRDELDRPPAARALERAIIDAAEDLAEPRACQQA